MLLRKWYYQRFRQFGWLSWSLKKTTLSIWTALPKTLVYLMGPSHPEQQPIFATVTNGHDILFVKLLQQPQRNYTRSRVFSH
jgi:hypothetical protein